MLYPRHTVTLPYLYILHPPSFFFLFFPPFFYPSGAALTRALRYFQTLAGCGMLQGCRRLCTLAPLLPFFFASRTDVCKRDVSVRVAHRIRGGACARSRATLMRSYLPAFAKTARVHRYCAALNGGTRCTVPAAYQVRWCCPSFFGLWLDGRRRAWATPR